MEATPFNLQDVLGNVGSSNEARVRLLERRMKLPPSPSISSDKVRQSVGLPAHQYESATLQSAVSDLHHSNSIPADHIGTPQVSASSEGFVIRSQREGAGEAETAGQASGRTSNGDDDSGQASAQKRPLETIENVFDSGKKGKRRERSTTPSASFRPSLSPFLSGGDGSKHAASTPGSGKKKQKNTINKYFSNTSNFFGDVNKAPGVSSQKEKVLAASDSVDDRPSYEEVRLEKDELREEVGKLRLDLKIAQKSAEEATKTINRLKEDCERAEKQASNYKNSARELLLHLGIESAKQERELKLLKLQQAAPRLGSITVRRCGLDVQEVWEDGGAFYELKKKLDHVTQQREEIEAARKACKRRLPLPGQSLPGERSCGEIAASDGKAMLHPDDWVVQEEIFKVRLAAIKREEESYKSDLVRLEAEKSAHVRELKRVRDEESSRFSSFPVLNNRYLLMNLLGRGGFSEVYRALDLVDHVEVAVKIHQLSSQWSEAKKASYVRHSVREYHIHRQMNHPRIVRLLDIFEIDNNTFATVLELCIGGDLENYIRAQEVLPEREARAIISQVLGALCYLNTKPRSIIHYDLKPANILFDSRGEVKITDFGLSKVVEDGHTRGMELTSQGAGTYWYLPPECFDLKSTPLISNKVDVWSVGIIAYQMLYGKRPFGHEQSQEQILRNEVMLNAKQVHFPTRPSVSNECKDFIRSCLTYRQCDRMDVHEAAGHAFLDLKAGLKKDRKTTSAKD